MFGLPVHRLLAELPAVEFDAWAVYRKRYGLAHRESHLLLARLCHAFFSVNRGKDSDPPALAEFYRALREDAQGEGASRYTADERKTLGNLMGQL